MSKPTNPRKLSQSYSSDSTMETTRPKYTDSKYDLVILQLVALVNKNGITQKFANGKRGKISRQLSLSRFRTPQTQPVLQPPRLLSL